VSLTHYSFFPGDYLRDTLHLGWLEDLAYRRLLDLYYSRGKPITNDRSYIMRALRASEPEQQTAVDNILSEFFELCADGWHNRKADEEIAYYREKSEKAKIAADIRWKTNSNKNKDVTDADALRTQYGRNAPTPTPTPKEVNLCSANALQVETAEKPAVCDVPPQPVLKANGVPYGRIVDLYHQILPELPRCLKLTEARRAQIRGRWAGGDMDKEEEWVSYFQKVRQSRFLMGMSPASNGHKVFRADLEWLTRDGNCAKVWEGKYDG